MFADGVVRRHESLRTCPSLADQQSRVDPDGQRPSGAGHYACRRARENPHRRGYLEADSYGPVESRRFATRSCRDGLCLVRLRGGKGLCSMQDARRIERDRRFQPSCRHETDASRISERSGTPIQLRAPTIDSRCVSATRAAGSSTPPGDGREHGPVIEGRAGDDGLESPACPTVQSERGPHDSKFIYARFASREEPLLFGTFSPANRP